MKRRVVRCPKCGSTEAGSDEAKSFYEITYMRCLACGYHELCDTWQISFDWNLDIELEEDADLPAFCAPLAPGTGAYDTPVSSAKPAAPPAPPPPAAPPAPVAPLEPPPPLARLEVIRCPACGSTAAGRDELRSALELSHMRCLVCDFGEDCDASKVRSDWTLGLEVAEGTEPPPFVEPLGTEPIEPRPLNPRPPIVRWKVMGEDTFARESYLVGWYGTEAAAKAAVAEREARHQATQDEGVRDQVWFVKVESEDT